VSDSSKKAPCHTVRADRDAVSAVKLSQQLTAEIDAWAEAHQTVRSDAIRQLVEFGLSATRDTVSGAISSEISLGHIGSDPFEIEDEAISQISRLLDPALPLDERERRIRRLTEGPPEFSDERRDLPKHKK
jgi:hypothetical protein